MSLGLKIASVCRILPTPDEPTAGLFVAHRLDGMGQFAEVVPIQPVAHFPGYRPLPHWAKAQGDRYLPMFYIPRVLKSLDSLWMSRALLPRLGALHRDIGLDVIDAHWGYPEAVACRTVAKSLGIPYCVTLRGHEFDYLEKPLFKERIKVAFRDAAACICVSNALAELALDAGVDERKVKVIHNAVDASVFAPGEKLVARSALELACDRPVVFSVGQVIPGKRPLDLLHAMRGVVDQKPDAHLYVAGSLDSDPKHVAAVNKGIRELGLTEHVTLLGAIEPDRIKYFYQAADVFCLMTEREGCCNAILEALASDLPVVTTPVGDNAVFVKPPVNGALVEVGDRKGAAESILQILREPFAKTQVATSFCAKSWTDVGREVIHTMQEAIISGATDG